VAQIEFAHPAPVDNFGENYLKTGREAYTTGFQARTVINKNYMFMLFINDLLATQHSSNINFGFTLVAKLLCTTQVFASA